MMFGFFINLSGLFSIFSAPFSAGVSAAGSLMQERARRRALVAMGEGLQDMRVTVPRAGRQPRDMAYLTAYRQWFSIVEGKTNIPKVEKRK